jgi:hypothetical protein
VRIGRRLRSEPRVVQGAVGGRYHLLRDVEGIEGTYCGAAQWAGRFVPVAAYRWHDEPAHCCRRCRLTWVSRTWAREWSDTA